MWTQNNVLTSDVQNPITPQLALLSCSFLPGCFLLANWYHQALFSEIYMSYSCNSAWCLKFVAQGYWFILSEAMRCPYYLIVVQRPLIYQIDFEMVRSLHRLELVTWWTVLSWVWIVMFKLLWMNNPSRLTRINVWALGVGCDDSVV